MIRTTIATALAAVLVATPVSAGTEYDRDTLQRDLTAIHEAGVTGVLAEVDVGKRRLVARTGTGNLDNGEPVPYRAYFRMGSNTKTFVAVVVLQLVAEGKLALDDTVERWLPGVVAGNGNDGRRITVRQLLQHTSGLHDYARELPLFSKQDFLAHRFDDYRPEQLVAAAMQHPPDFQPGTSWNYSNTGYQLAGMIIQRATGNTWLHEVEKRVIRPLGLRDTFSRGSRPDLPRPHARSYSKFPGEQEFTDTSLLNMTWGGAAGELVTTTKDLQAFWQGLLGGRLLEPAQLAQMKTTVVAETWQEFEPGIRYGLGITSTPLSCGELSWGHGGDLPGYATRNGFAENGRRGIVISRSSQVLGEMSEQATKQAIDNVLC